MSAAVSGNSVPGAVQSGQQAPAATSSANPFGQYASTLNGATANQAANGITANTATGATTTQTEAPPGAAVSAYEYQQYIASAPLVLGPQIAGILGLSPTGTVTGDQVIQAFYTLNQGELAQLEEYLYYAGMYANTAGEQSTTRPEFGTPDIDAFNALSQAVLQASNGKSAGETLSGFLANRIASGAGQAAIQGAISPITGGGNAYQINLTSPTDVYATAMAVFQQYLGRNPTQSELDSIVSQVQSQQTQYQSAMNTQEESTKQQQYQQAINSRTAQLTPATINGPVPNGPFQNPGQYAVALLQYLGDPVTASNVSVITAWISALGGMDAVGTNNPLGVSTGGPGAKPAAGAENYVSPSQGLQATANLLNSPQYFNLAAALATGQGSTYASSSAVKAELSQWSGGKVTSLNTAAQTNSATQAIQNYVAPTAPGQAQPLAATRAEAKDESLNGPMPSQGTAGPIQSFRAAAPNYVGSPSQNYVPPAQVAGGQGISAPGDNYLPSNTLTATTPPSATSVATTEATTGANAVPYLGNQYLQAYQSILSLIQGGYK